MKIRNAEEKDIKAIGDIVNKEITNGTSIFDLEPKSIYEWTSWFELHRSAGYPVIVAEENGETAGFASLSRYRAKAAYDTTAELSVYVHENYRGMGIGSALTEQIITIAKQEKKLHIIISVITSDNHASIKMHKRLGFEFCGRIPEVGYKFGRYLSLDSYVLKI